MAAATVCMDTVYELGGADDVITTDPTMAKSSTPRRPNNIYETALKPVTISLKIFGMGENNFQSWPLWLLYIFYYLCMLAFCSFTVYNTYMHQVINAMLAATLSNILDQYAWMSAAIIWFYILLTTLIFVAWAVKWRRISSMARLLDEEGFDFLHKLEDEKDQVLTKAFRKLVIKSYVIWALFTLEVLIWPALVFIYKGTKTYHIVYTLAFVPTLLINWGLAMATIIHMCTAEIWAMYNYSIRKDSQQARISKNKNMVDFESIISKYSDRYDAVSNLTAAVAHIYRYYTIIHCLTVISLVANVYQTLMDKYSLEVFNTYAWVDTIIYLTPLFAAATISNNSIRVPTNLHNFYKAYWGKNRNRLAGIRSSGASNRSVISDRSNGWMVSNGSKDTNMNNRPAVINMNGVDQSMMETGFGCEGDQRQPCPLYSYFYRRVAGTDMCIGVDIAGVISITKTTVAGILFAAVNWVAVMLQFRQGASGQIEDETMRANASTSKLIG